MTDQTIIVVNVADLPDPNDSRGRSYRQVNAAKTHKIPIGALVEIESGARLFVVFQGRDCDQEPLYWLSPEADDTERANTTFGNRLWTGGYGEESLTVIKLPLAYD